MSQDGTLQRMRLEEDELNRLSGRHITFEALSGGIWFCSPRAPG